ncbi:MAG TPA: hypothetical protein VFW21_08750 [Mycobacterium sp.]|nr:hypothetical protein [Mycobacterium sp.]
MTPIDVVVDRCVVQVVRHGGWSWGPQPHRLVDQVIAALPALIAERLGDLASPGGPDTEITEPVRIEVSLRLADLLADRLDPIRSAQITMDPLLKPSPATLSVPSAATRRPSDPLPREVALPARAQTATLMQFLAGLFNRGEIDDFLALLPLETLETWYQTLAALPATPSTEPNGAGAISATAPDRIPRRGSDLTSDFPALLALAAASSMEDRIRELRDIIAATAPDRVPPRGSDLTSDVLALLAPVTGSSVTDRARQLRDTITAVAAWAGRLDAAGLLQLDNPAGARRSDSRSTPSALAPTEPRAPQPNTAPRTNRSVDVASALPFLLLGPLAQTGYLSALVPALQAVGLEQETAAFATALAYTVLGPLDRGWRRQPDDVAAAAAFAGVDPPVPGPALAEFARVATPTLPALNAVVTRALAEGHTAGEPLVLVGVDDRAGGGLLLIDREGLFPVAWTDNLDGLLPAWRACGSPPILVGPTAASALRGLTSAGARFVVGTPPARGDHWRQLAPHRLWTNDQNDPALARYAGAYHQVLAQTGALVQTLAVDRVAVPLAGVPALGRSLLLAAGLGLGTLAWTLWRQREPTDPLLALERFADLSARVSVEPSRVRVRLPLGPRHTDLSEHGLLADVRGVPWLGDRVVEFSGG